VANLFAGPADLRPSLVVPVAVVLGILLLGLKAGKAFMVAPGIKLKAVIPLMRGDLVVVGVFACVAYALGLLTAGRRRLALAARILFSVVVLLLFLLPPFEHKFFVATGAQLDLALVVFAARNLSEIKGMIGRELSLAFWALLILGPVVLAVSSWLAARLPSWPSAALVRPARPLPQAVGALFVAALLVTVNAAVPLRVRGPQSPLATQMYRSFLHASFSGDQAAEARGAKKAFDKQAYRLVPSGPDRPNVVFIVLESTRALATSLYSDLKSTPFLASLTDHAVVAEAAYTVVPHTTKALVPIHCGIEPKISTSLDETSPGAVPARCLPELLKPLGYGTGFIQAAVGAYEGRGALVRNLGFENFQGGEQLPKAGFQETSYFGFEDRVMLGPAVKFAEQMKAAGKPFMLSMLTLQQHHTYRTPSGFEKQRFAPNPGGDKHAEEYNSYLNTLLYVDGMLKDLFAQFEKLGLMDNTVFVITGDHGEGFFEHGRGEHDTVIYEEGLRVPLMIYSRKHFPAGKKARGLRRVVDILPTLYEMLGYKIDGKSALPGQSLLHDVAQDRPVFASCWYLNYCMSMRKGDLKFVYHYGRQPMEVFDLGKDPLEKEDLAHSIPRDAQHAAKNAMLEWKASINAAYEVHSRRNLEGAVSKTPFPVANATRGQLGDYLEYLGHDLHTAVVPVGTELDITYYFRVKQKVPPGWKLFVHVEGPGRRNLNGDHDPVNGALPLSKLSAGDYLADRQRLYIPAFYPPNGVMNIFMGVWKGKDRLPVTGTRTDGQNRIRVTQVRLFPPPVAGK
jgi:arylsulfatase A-like enzyme